MAISCPPIVVLSKCLMYLTNFCGRFSKTWLISRILLGFCYYLIGLWKLQAGRVLVQWMLSQLPYNRSSPKVLTTAYVVWLLWFVLWQEVLYRVEVTTLARYSTSWGDSLCKRPSRSTLSQTCCHKKLFRKVNLFDRTSLRA